MFRVGAVNINGSEMSSWVEASTYTAELDGELQKVLLIFSVGVLLVALPYRMKICTEFNIATQLRLVKFTELNISKF